MYVCVCNQSSGSSFAVYHHEARRLKIRVSKKEENINSGRWSGREVVGGYICPGLVTPAYAVLFALLELGLGAGVLLKS